MRRNFSGRLWSKSFVSKNRVLTEIFQGFPTRFWDPIFKNQVFVDFPYIESVWCVVCPWFFLPTQRTKLGGPSRYLEHGRKMRRKVSGRLWSKRFASKNRVLTEIFRASRPDFETRFSKIRFLSLFLTYNLFGACYDPDCFADVKNKVRWTF